MKISAIPIICSLNLLVLLAVFMGSCTQDTQDVSNVTQERALIETKCQQCHSLDRIKQAHLDKDTTRQVVERMRKKEGAKISEDEAEIINNALGDYFSVAPSPPVVPAPLK